MPNYIIRESFSWRGERECCLSNGAIEFAKGKITRTETYPSEPGDVRDVVYTFEEDSTNQQETDHDEL